METIKELENKMRVVGIKLMPIDQIASIKTGSKVLEAWDKIEKIGKRISNSWKSELTSWQIISEGRR